MNKIINIDLNEIKIKSKVHLLPCKINYNGKTDVESFFINSIVKKQINKEEILNEEKEIIEG